MSVTLTGLTWDDKRGGGPLQTIAEAFANVSGVSVELKWDVQPLSGFESTPLAETAGRYDLLIMDHPHVAAAARSHLLHPIDELEGEYVGRSLESYQFQGRQWAVPIDAACQVAVYRPMKDFEAPSLWSDVLKLKRRGTRVALPLAGVHSLLALLTLTASFGESVDGPINWGKSKAVRSSATLLRQLCEGDSRVGLDWSPIDAHRSLANDDCDYVPLAFGYSHWQDQGVRFATPPAWEADRAPRTVLGGAGLAVSAASDHPTLATQFVRFFGSAYVQRDLCAMHGGQPAHTDAWDALAADCFFGTTRSTIENAFIRPQREDWNELQIAGGNLIEQWLRTDEADPTQLLSRLDECWNDSIATVYGIS